MLLEGANGAGKTSLLRACAGLLAVTSGSAEVLGHDLVRDRRRVRRDIGLLGHATSLYDDLTVVDNVRFATRASGGRSDAVDEAMERVGLTGRLRTTAVGRLSAGQRRRTALAILVARDPELWLLDEPHAGLDAEHRDLLDALVRDAAARGATVLLASHEHERASSLAGRVLTMAGGQIVPSPVDRGAPGEAAPIVGADSREPPAGNAAPMPAETARPAAAEGGRPDPVPTVPAVVAADGRPAGPGGPVAGGARPRRRPATRRLRLAGCWLSRGGGRATHAASGSGAGRGFPAAAGDPPAPAPGVAVPRRRPASPGPVAGGPAAVLTMAAPPTEAATAATGAGIDTRRARGATEIPPVRPAPLPPQAVHVA